MGRQGIVSMHPLTDALPDYLDALALRQACGEIEAQLRAELAQISNEAWDAAYQRAQVEWAEEVKRLRDALEQLARLGNGDRYGNSVGNQIAIAALTPAEEPKT